MASPVAGTIADWGRTRGYYTSPRTATPSGPELTYILIHEVAAYNSPVWPNVGFEGSSSIPVSLDAVAAAGSRGWYP